MIGKTVRLWIAGLNRTSQVTYTVIEEVGGGSYMIECDSTGTRTFATADAMREVMNLEQCYHPCRTHGTCPAGHPIHHDTENDHPFWTHCTVADLVTCPWELAADPTGYQARHDSGAISG